MTEQSRLFQNFLTSVDMSVIVLDMQAKQAEIKV
jgi:hypothetical protein